MKSTSTIITELAVRTLDPVDGFRRWEFTEPIAGSTHGSAAEGISAEFDRLADQASRLVWRTDFSAPGFCLLETASAVDSHTLRAAMVALKESLSEIHRRLAGLRLVYRSLGRFDQQESTKFHLDGGPDASVLILGYKPSKVRNELLLADYSRAANDVGITPKRFLEDFNPMFRRSEERLFRYFTELEATIAVRMPAIGVSQQTARNAVMTAVTVAAPRDNLSRH